jgi:hypothetical protein
MKIRTFVLRPFQNHVYYERLDEDLLGAIHVETYSLDEKMFGGHHTIFITAFYSDDNKKKAYSLPSLEGNGPSRRWRAEAERGG